MKYSARLATSCILAFRAAVLALVLGTAPPAFGAPSCTFDAGQPGSTSFGAINPTLSTPATFSVTLNIKCTGGGVASFTITGLNDSGPGVYRLKHNTQVPAQYMRYAITTVVVPGTSITLNGQIVATDYQDAYVGPYSDTLTVLVLP